jgi:hypothetical protein
VTLLSTLSSSKLLIIIKCLFFLLVRFQWIIILDFFVIFCFEIGSNIFRDLFLKLALHMSWIVIFCRIMNPSMDRKCDKVTYMLCILKHTLSGGCRRSMIKLSNVCPCALKSVRKKGKAISNWYLFDYECFGGVWFQYVMVILEILWYGYYWYDIFREAF